MICLNEGLCVTLTPTEFIYTAGMETGVAVGFTNYPRFPKTPDDLWVMARKVAHRLTGNMYQRSCLLVGPDKTEWITFRPEDVNAEN